MQVEGLDEVVVCAGIEAGYAVGHSIARGEDQDGDGDAALAQLAHHVESVALGQAEVEQHEVEHGGAGFRTGGTGGAGRGHGVHGSLAVTHPIDGETVVAQTLAHAIADHVVVFYEQYAHGRIKNRPGRPIVELPRGRPTLCTEPPANSPPHQNPPDLIN